MSDYNSDLSNLNDQQKAAVLSNTKRLLVLAGAGSGKTKTLLQKIIYLIEEKNVSPSSILAITFTKNAANEMIDRLIISADRSGEYHKILSDKTKKPADIRIKRFEFSRKYKWISKLTVRTIHSMCYSIMKNYGVSEFDNKFKIIGDKKVQDEEWTKFSATETVFEVVHKILIELCDDNEYLLGLKRHLLDYMVDRIHVDKNKRKFLSSNGKFYTSLKGTKVRSKSEQYIADWLYRHSIDYVYEPKVNFKDFDFRPDFFVPQANVYIEHISKLSYPLKDKEDQFELAQKYWLKHMRSRLRIPLYLI